jgi:uncharacterized protein (DUF1330 family)
VDARLLIFSEDGGVCRCAKHRDRHCQARKRQQGEQNIPAYLVAEVEVTNPAGFEPYRTAVGATVTQYGGRFQVRGGATELIEGEPEPKTVVIIEFADATTIKRWYDSPEYQTILPSRLDNSTGRRFIVEGVS